MEYRLRREKKRNHLFSWFFEEGFKLVQLLVIVVPPVGETLGNVANMGGSVGTGGGRRVGKLSIWTG